MSLIESRLFDTTSRWSEYNIEKLSVVSVMSTVQGVDRDITYQLRAPQDTQLLRRRCILAGTLHVIFGILSPLEKQLSWIAIGQFVASRFQGPRKQSKELLLSFHHE